jgi:hypothetical protein
MEDDEPLPFFRADLVEYRKEEKNFYPNIDSSKIIYLDGTRSSLLDWREAISQARNLQAKGEVIVWEMVFDQIGSSYPLDTATMYRAATEFSEKVYPEFEKESFGIILGRFSKDSDALVSRLHEIGSFFPEHLLVFALFDVSKIESALTLASLFSKERYDHICLGFKGASIPLFGLNWEYGKAYGGSLDGDINTCQAKIAICLPAKERLTAKIEEEFNAICRQFNEEGVDYRIFPESLFTESWRGLDQIIVFQDALDPKTGFRKCQGFSIAGGEIIYAN